ncbi:MAG TPA: NTP transferase domain-containing protein, partial [Vicinamibacterales bacterium]|nr:NTP transferase domain-containing protein [Vicinamibacterales bacterium]
MSGTISAAILAGGRATRFGGRDKSAIVIDPQEGRTILDRQIDALRPLTDDIMIVGRPAHPSARTIADRIADS